MALEYVIHPIRWKDRILLTHLHSQCNPNLIYNYSDDGTSIIGATVTANDNICDVPIPVTFPGAARTDDGESRDDKVGEDPLIIWTTLSGSPVSFTLDEPIVLL